MKSDSTSSNRKERIKFTKKTRNRLRKGNNEENDKFGRKIYLTEIHEGD